MLKNQHEVLAWSQNHRNEAKLTTVLSNSIIKYSSENNSFLNSVG